MWNPVPAHWLYYFLCDSRLQARDSQTSIDEQFRQELTAQARLANLYKMQVEESKNKMTELTGAVEELQKLLKEANTGKTSFYPFHSVSLII